MAEQLITTSIVAPGFQGLNTQESSVTLESGFATIAENCVIDKFGRIGARKGWLPVNATSAALGSDTVSTIFELVKEDGNVVISAGNNKLFTGTSTLTQAAVRNTTNTTDLTYTITDDHWDIASQPFSSGQGASAHAFLAQAGHPTLVYHKLPTTGTGAQLTVSTVSGTGDILTYTISTAGTNYAVNDSITLTGGSGSGALAVVDTVDINGGITGIILVDNGTGYTATNVLNMVDETPHSHEAGYGFQRLADVGELPSEYSALTFTPNVVLAAFGRIWYADITGDTQTIYFSDLNAGSYLNSGTAGSLNIGDIVPDGDPIVSLAAHNGFLVIFCKRHIVIYANANDITNLILSDLIKGVGCIARDSVANTGTDLLFLSNAGVRSLLRTIQEKSSPIRDVSATVRDDLVKLLNTETAKQVKSAYYERDAFYVISFPTSDICYCFDLRGTLQNGALKATSWRTKITAFSVTSDRKLYLGKAGYIGNYTGYIDNTAPFTLSYYTNWFDLGQPTINKILKKIAATFIGGRGMNVTVKWAFDYGYNYQQTSYTLASPSVAEYGIAEYGIGEYTAGVVFDNQATHVGGTGRVIQLGFEIIVNGSEISLQKIDCYVKAGKLR
jgi:hypothetical protein